MTDHAPEIDPRLLEILVCPLTKGPLNYDRAAQELISLEAGLAYPIRDGIPIMLVDEARPLGEEEKARLMGGKPAAQPQP
ncbi:MAG TPA: Trm112 family protein [Stellaceae bacterium]|nr:Trm112 family protein [Stellaceae bacterium]